MALLLLLSWWIGGVSCRIEQWLAVEVALANAVGQEEAVEGCGGQWWQGRWQDIRTRLEEPQGQHSGHQAPATAETLDIADREQFAKDNYRNYYKGDTQDTQFLLAETVDWLENAYKEGKPFWWSVAILLKAIPGIHISRFWKNEPFSNRKKDT